MSSHRDTVKKILDSKAVDFNAIGKIVSEIGPGIALEDEPWENFCWTMRMFISFYRRPGPWGGPFQVPGNIAEEGIR